MKIYNYRKGSEWVESDYAPYNFAWAPRKARKWFTNPIVITLLLAVLGLAILFFWPVGL